MAGDASGRCPPTVSGGVKEGPVWKGEYGMEGGVEGGNKGSERAFGGPTGSGVMGV